MTLKRSFPPVVDANTRLLICGSLPGEDGERNAPETYCGIIHVRRSSSKDRD